MKISQVACSLMGAVLMAGVAQASPISIYTAPDDTYKNSINNPCVFYGPGVCNNLPPGWPVVGNTQVPDPVGQFDLTNTYGDAPGELALFGQYVGREFFLGLDINDTSDPQTLDYLTINFFDVNGVNIGNYTLASPTAVDSNANGSGWADFVLSAGCLGTVGGGGGVLATCTNYAPFIAPAATRSLTFTMGMDPANDGPDKLFLISAGPRPIPFSEDPPTVTPEPASLLLLGSGLLGVVRTMRKRKAVV